MAQAHVTPLKPARTPPHANEAEQSLLGGLMLSPSAWDKVADRVGEHDFYRETHGLIFRAIGELREDNQPCDAVTVGEWFDRHGKLELVEGGAYLTWLVTETPGPTNAAAYADIIREKSILRQLIDIGSEIAETALDPDGRESRDVLEMAEQRIYKIAEQGSRRASSYIPIRELLGPAMDRLGEICAQDGEITGVPTSFDQFDGLTAGLQPSDLIIVAGRPAMGKCLSHDAEIVLEDGSVATIEDVYQCRNSRVGTLRADMKLDMARPSDYVDDGKKPVFEVVTRLGRRVETTATHPFLTLDGWKPLAEIEPGEFVAVPRGLPVFGTASMRECEIKLLAYMIGDGGLTGSTPRFTATNPEIQRDFIAAVSDFGGLRARAVKQDERAPSWWVTADAEAVAAARTTFAGKLCGMLGASGHSARAVAQAVGVSPASLTHWRQGKSVPDPECLDRLSEVLGVEPDQLVPGGGASARRNKPNPLYTWLEEQRLGRCDAHGKHIPASVFRLPRAQLALFLNRLFAIDGWATVLSSGQAQLGYATVSERLARQVQHLLLRFGILAKLRQRWVRYREQRRVSWQLDITHADSMARFVEEIGIHGKQAAVDTVARVLEHKQAHSNTDLIPIEVWKWLEEEKGDMSWAELARRAGVAGSNIHAHRRGLSRARLARFAMALQSRRLMSLAHSDVYWDRVESITALGHKQVYDLTIPETHNFIANDICVHNTTFAVNIAENAALRQKVPVAVFSMEMSAMQLVMRMFSSLGQVDQNRLRTGKLSDQDWVNLQSALEILNKANIYIDETPSLSPSEVRARARRMKREHDIGLVVVDYLQLMQVPGNKENRATEIAEISRSLKALAKELNIPVIALSQLNRALEQRPNKRPVMADLRESGSIEQDADLIIFIYRDEVYNEDTQEKGKAEIIIGKHRNGATGKVDLVFQGEYLRFRNFTPDYYGLDE